MASSPAAATFRRPTADDAFALARRQFIAGERVEMRTLSQQLDINRTTLYRWVGDREHLLGVLFSSLVEEWVEAARADAQGSGVDWFCDLLRRILQLGASFEPLTTFTRREPALALRIITDRDGPVTTRSRAITSGLIAEAIPGPQPSEAVIASIALVSQTLVWTNIATDQQPDVDGAVDVVRTLLECTTT